jgi:hypothetical protein
VGNVDPLTSGWRFGLIDLSVELVNRNH